MSGNQNLLNAFTITKEEFKMKDMMTSKIKSKSLSKECSDTSYQICTVHKIGGSK